MTPNAGQPPPQPSHAVLEQAAQWYARLRDGSAGARDRAVWQTWLHAAEEHQAAWRYVEDISRGFEPLRNLPDSRPVAEALRTANERLHTRRRLLAGVALLAGGALFGTLGWRQALLPAGLLAWAADYRTGTGEQRELALADGTRLWLNTDSAIDVQFDAFERRIRLVTGEIFIDTATDASRPFLVDTAQGRLRPLGTRFNVRMEGGATRLAVFEGAVEIRTSAAGATRIVPTDRQTRFTGEHIAPVERADIAREAWTRGTLAIDDMPLGEVIRELRRYRKGHLGVADEIADLTVYGNFPIQDTDRVLSMLATALPIRIEQPLPWWTRVEARR